MLTHEGFNEAEKRQITIDDTDVGVLEQILNFMYTGGRIQPQVLQAHAEELYRAAAKYFIEGLVQLCGDYLLQNVKVENALVMYDLAQCRPKSFLAVKSLHIIFE